MNSCVPYGECCVKATVLSLVKYLLFTVPRYPPGGSYQYMFEDGLASPPCERMLMQPDMHSDTEGHKVGF